MQVYLCLSTAEIGYALEDTRMLITMKKQAHGMTIELIDICELS